MEDTKLNPPWKELLKHATDWEHGSTHSHDEISNIMGVPKNTTMYYDYTNRVGEELSKMGKRIVNERNVGYRVLLPEEYPMAAYIDSRKAGRQYKRGLDHVIHAPIDKMDDQTKSCTESVGTHMSRSYLSIVSNTAKIMELSGITPKQKMLLKSRKE